MSGQEQQSVEAVWIDSYYVLDVARTPAVAEEPLVAEVDQVASFRTVKSVLEWVGGGEAPAVVSMYDASRDGESRGAYLGSLAVLQHEEILPIDHILTNDYRPPWLATAQRSNHNLDGSRFLYRARPFESHLPTILPNIYDLPKDDRPVRHVGIVGHNVPPRAFRWADELPVCVALRAQTPAADRFVDMTTYTAAELDRVFELENLFPHIDFASRRDSRSD